MQKPAGAAGPAGPRPTSADRPPLDGPPPRRRQARGERRAQQLLDAAAAVFVRTGYAAASTNAIARAAGVSPGTLYQFFPNKEALAVELGRRYNHRLQETHSGFTPANAALPLAEMLDVTLDPVIDFCAENPGFEVLLQSTDAPGLLVEEHEAVHSTIMAAVEAMVALRAPDLPPEAVTRTTAMAFAVFKAGLELFMATEGEARQRYRTEIKNALHGYLAPVIGTGAVLPRPAS